MKILQIDTSPRLEGSNSRALTNYLVNRLDGDSLVVRDLAAYPLPPVTAENLRALYASNDNGNPDLQRHVDISSELLGELKAADVLVIGIAVHNFSVPLVLKQWIDYVCRAGHSFRYTESGPQGLCDIRAAYLVVASGGTEIGSDIDFASTYMTHLCKFIGAKAVHIIDASGSKRTPDEVLAKGKAQIDGLLNEKIVA